MKKLVIAALVCSFTAASAQQLKLNLSPGSKYQVVSIMNVTSSASVMGQTMESKMDNEATENYEVSKVAANSNELKLKTDKIKIAISAMGQDMNYDSEKKDNTGELANAFKDKIGKEITVLYDDNGKVLNPDIVKTIQPDAVVPGMVGPNGNVALLETSFLGKEMTPGTNWFDSVTTVADKMSVTTKGTYKVLSVQNNTASILFEGTRSQNGVVEQMGMEMNMSGVNNLTREIMVDLKTGLFIQYNSKTTGTNNIETMGMSIPVEITTSSTIKVKQL